MFFLWRTDDDAQFRYECEMFFGAGAFYATNQTFLSKIPEIITLTFDIISAWAFGPSGRFLVRKSDENA